MIAHRPEMLEIGRQEQIVPPRDREAGRAHLRVPAQYSITPYGAATTYDELLKVATVPGKLAEFSGDGKHLYVLSRFNNELTVFDLATLKPVGVAKLAVFISKIGSSTPS